MTRLRATRKNLLDRTNAGLALSEEIASDLDKHADYLAFLHERDGVTGGTFTLTAGTATTLTGAGFICYRIGGEDYYAVLDTTITLETGTDITQAKFGAWRIVIDRTGVVTTQAASAAMAFDTEEEALLSLSSIPRTANTATLGYLTVTDSNSTFVIGTSNLDASGVTATPYVVRGPHYDNGLTSAMGANIAIGSTNTRYSTGTINVKTRGVRVAEISAQADKAFDKADVITSSGQYAGHLIVTGLAGTDTYALASTGIAGSVQTMTHATSAAAHAQLDVIQAALPEMFTVVGRIVTLAAKASFTFATDDLAGTDGTGVFTSETAAEFDRATGVTTGFGANAPTIPPALTEDATPDTIHAVL